MFVECRWKSNVNLTADSLARCAKWWDSLKRISQQIRCDCVKCEWRMKLNSHLLCWAKHLKLVEVHDSCAVCLLTSTMHSDLDDWGMFNNNICAWIASGLLVEALVKQNVTREIEDSRVTRRVKWWNTHTWRHFYVPEALPSSHVNFEALKFQFPHAAMQHSCMQKIDGT